MGRRFERFVPDHIVAVRKLQRRQAEAWIMIEGVPLTHQPLQTAAIHHDHRHADMNARMVGIELTHAEIKEWPVGE